MEDAAGRRGASPRYNDDMRTNGRSAPTALVFLLTGSLALTAVPPAAPQEASPARFQPAIDAFLEQDRVKPPPRGSILFIGSSIFRQWEALAEKMAPLPVFNRAFGGSRTSDLLFYMDRVVFPYAPKIIVYYCGSNDVNAGEKGDAIAGRFREFVRRTHEKLPGTRVFFVSINRAPQKRDRWDVVDDANRRTREFCASDGRLGFIDVNPALFDPAGNPRMELYQPDKLHLRPAAYLEFTAIIKPVIAEAWGK